MIKTNEPMIYSVVLMINANTKNKNKTTHQNEARALQITNFLKRYELKVNDICSVSLSV